MNIWDRLVFVMSGRFAPSPQVKSTVAALRPSWEQYAPTYATSAKFDVLVQEGYRKNELIFACIGFTALTGAQIELTMTDPAGKRIEAHPLLSLMAKPNPNMSEAEFWAAVIMYQKLAGRAIFEIERTQGGEPIALWPLRPDWVEVIPATNRPVVAAYLYKVPGEIERELRPVNVLDFPLFDPLDQYSAYPPVAVAARVGDIDNNITDFIKILMEHGGMPMGILKTVQPLTDDQAQDVRRRWQSAYGGFENWATNIGVLDRDAEFQRTGFTMAEMAFDSLDARDEARICAVLQVPPILVGAKIGLDKGTYANYETALKSWWYNIIIPTYNTLLDTLSSQLLPQYDKTGRLQLGWDLSRVNALGENADNLWARVNTAFNSGLLTLAQAVDLIGVGLPQGTTGEYYLRPSGVTMVLVADADTKPEPPPQLTSQSSQEGENWMQNEGQEEGEPEGEEVEDEKYLNLLAELKISNSLLKRVMDEPATT